MDDFDAVRVARGCRRPPPTPQPQPSQAMYEGMLSWDPPRLVECIQARDADVEQMRGELARVQGELDTSLATIAELEAKLALTRGEVAEAIDSLRTVHDVELAEASAFAEADL